MRRRAGLAVALAIGSIVATAFSTVPSSRAAGDGAGAYAASSVAASVAVAAEPSLKLVTATPRHPTVRRGDDWSLPSWARTADDSGFFSEDAAPTDHVRVRSVDLSWRQVQPEPGPLDLGAAGEAQGMTFDPLGVQLDEAGPYWVRMFSTGVDWAPRWVIRRCDVHTIGRDYDGERHLPIWNPCVWSHLRHTWQRLLVGQGILDDPAFRFAYVPGGFTWSEFDFDVISQAHRHGYVTKDRFLTWFGDMLGDFATMAGRSRGRLVYTGEDYPWGPFGRADDLLATRAVRAGLGVRTGISELSNFHLSETPAYGSHIKPTGHLGIRARPPTGSAGRVTATENECYVDCGYHAQHLRYAVEMSNLKALQLRMNWLYVVPGPSRLDTFGAHWNWVRRSLGHRAADSADAWAALRTATDEFWRYPDPPFGPHGRVWHGRPWVRNLERWLVQRDVPPRAVAHRSRAAVYRHEIESDNGVALEGLRTRLARGDDSLALDLADAFLGVGTRADVLIKVTYLDRGHGRWWVRTAHGRTPAIALHDTDRWKTATFRVNGFAARDALPGGTDFWLTANGSDLTARFVRVVKLHRP
jgi:hypothetical protein